VSDGREREVVESRRRPTGSLPCEIRPEPEIDFYAGLFKGRKGGALTGSVVVLMIGFWVWLWRARVSRFSTSSSGLGSDRLQTFHPTRKQLWPAMPQGVVR
jgi:hypothetical protein